MTLPGLSISRHVLAYMLSGLIVLFGVIAFHRQLQPRESRQSHFGAQSQQLVGQSLLDPPEVDRLAHAKVPVVAAAAPQSHAAHHAVEESTHLPGERE